MKHVLDVNCGMHSIGHHTLVECFIQRVYFIRGSLLHVLSCRICENGKTTVEKRDNGQLVSRKVDGQMVPIENGTEKKPGLTM